MLLNKSELQRDFVTRIAETEFSASKPHVPAAQAKLKETIEENKEFGRRPGPDAWTA
jgi:hypothetical protein